MMNLTLGLSHNSIVWAHLVQGRGGQKTCWAHMKELRSRIPPLSMELIKLIMVSRYVTSNAAKMGLFSR